MKTCFTCFFLWCKRILKRPLFWVTLFLLPCAVLFIQNCRTDRDAIVRVALYSPDTEDGSTANNLIDCLLELSNQSLTFYECSSKKELLEDVSCKNAACGYIIPEDCDASILSYVKEHEAFITVYRPKQEVTTVIVDEIVLSKLYQQISYYVLENFLENKTLSTVDKEELTAFFVQHTDKELLFQFEYADGSNNTILNDTDSNYLLMPIRGIVSVLILLSCMSGGLLWYADKSSRLLAALNRKKQRLYGLFSLLVPGLLSVIAGLITIQLTGISEGILKETFLLLIHLCGCMALTAFLRSLLKKRESFLAFLPLLSISSLLLCPVFVDSSNFIPSLSYLSKLLPSTWYLNSLHSTGNLLCYLVYTLLFAVLSFLCSHTPFFSNPET